MAYFNHAFSKAFVVDSFAAAGTKTSAFTPGQFEVVSSSWTAVGASSGAPITAGQLFYLVQGSFHTQDNIGNNPGHGGYSESVKSKGINAKFVSRLWSSECQSATAATVKICVGSTCSPCGSNLFLRLDVKGSPALRFLNHNAYAIGDSSGNANTNNYPGNCCVDGQTYLDPAVALAKAADMLLQDPIIKPFAKEKTGGGIEISATALNAAATLSTLVAGTGYSNGTFTGVATTGGTGTGLTLDITVAGGSVTAATIASPGNGYTAGDVVTIVGGNNDATVTVATLTQTAVYTIAEVLFGGYGASIDPVADGVTACVSFEGAYVDTKFGNCSFDTRDHYEKEPVQLIGSVLDETGDPCNDCGVVTTTPGTMQQTSGETVLRDILLTEAYMQSPYNQGNPDSARIREIEGSDDILAAIDRNALYKTYYIQHSIPRLNNPTGVFDNDQYVYKVYVKCTETADIALMDTLMAEIVTVANASGNPITFESDID